MFQWDIIGHQRQLGELEQDFSSGNLTHAYLAAGPEAIGKYTAMKRFAHILQCEQRFCRHCSTCLEIAKGYHADTIELVDDGESIKIETMRELLSRIAVTARSPYKIVLIKNIDRMTPEAANALLKTLEDPPSKVKFLFTTSNLPAILSTILSRLRLFQFQSLSETELATYLQGHYSHYPASDLTLAAVFSLGKIGKAIRLLQNPDLFRTYRQLHEQLSSLLKANDRVEQFRFIAELLQAEQGMEHFSIVLVALLRQKLVESSLRQDARETQKWLHALEFYYQAQEMKKRNVNERLLLENLMLSV